MNQRSHAVTRQLWIDRVTRFEQANQTVAQFCSHEGCSQASFYQWRRKLRDTPAKASLATFVPVKLSDSLPDQPSPSSQPTTVLSVELPGGARVRLEVTHTCEVQP